MQTENKEFFGLAYDKIFKEVVLNKEKDYRYLSKILSDILEDEINVFDAKVLELETIEVLAKTKTGEEINIILNNSFSEATLERNIIYYFSLISVEIAHYLEHKKTKKIFQINLNFHKIRKDFKEYIKTYNTTSNKVYYKDFEIINVNVLNYKKSYYAKNINGDLKHIYLVSLGSDKEELKKLGNVDELVKEVGNKVIELNEDEKIRGQIEKEKNSK